MGRDVGRDEGREQAEWRDLVARLELQTPIDPANAPWPDRENLRAKNQPGTVSSAAGSGLANPAGPAGPAPGSDASPGSDARPGSDASPGDDSSPGSQSTTGGYGRPANRGPEHATGSETAGSESAPGDVGDGDDGHRGRGSADRGRVIRPAASGRPGWPAEPTAELDADAGHGRGSAAEDGSAGLADPPLAGPRDFELDDPSDDDLAGDWDDRYIPPPLPPQPGLDPVAKGAWLALFGGPGYLLLATLLGWQIAGWAALVSVIAFVAGFVVLVFRLGDGPSKRDGPDQGAVV